MTATTSMNAPALSIRRNGETAAPTSALKDLFGLISGFRAYQVYTDLEVRSDPELRAMGLTREDLPRVAMSVMLDAQKRA